MKRFFTKKKIRGAAAALMMAMLAGCGSGNSEKAASAETSVTREDNSIVIEEETESAKDLEAIIRREFEDYLNTQVVPEHGIVTDESFRIPYVYSFKFEGTKYGEAIPATDLPLGILGQWLRDLDNDGVGEMLVVYRNMSTGTADQQAALKRNIEISFEIYDYLSGEVKKTGEGILDKRSYFGDEFIGRLFLKDGSDGIHICYSDGYYSYIDRDKVTYDFIAYSYKGDAVMMDADLTIEGSEEEIPVNAEWLSAAERIGLEGAREQWAEENMPHLVPDAEPNCDTLLWIGAKQNIYSLGQNTYYNRLDESEVGDPVGYYALVGRTAEGEKPEFFGEEEQALEPGDEGYYNGYYEATSGSDYFEAHLADDGWYDVTMRLDGQDIITADGQVFDDGLFFAGSDTQGDTYEGWFYPQEDGTFGFEIELTSWDHFEGYTNVFERQ